MVKAIPNQESRTLMEIVKLIGGDVLPDDQEADSEIARVIRLGFYSRTHSIRRIRLCLLQAAEDDGDDPVSL